MQKPITIYQEACDRYEYESINSCKCLRNSTLADTEQLLDANCCKTSAKKCVKMNKELYTVVYVGLEILSKDLLLSILYKTYC